MAKGKPGADSSVIVTTQIAGTGLIDLAKALYGDTPVFWGRYFTSASTGGTVEYRHLKENQALCDNNIRVLPIARQTKRVAGTVADGSADLGVSRDSTSDHPQTRRRHYRIGTHSHTTGCSRLCLAITNGTASVCSTEPRSDAPRVGLVEAARWRPNRAGDKNRFCC
jgi:hypothetical protein